MVRRRINNKDNRLEAILILLLVLFPSCREKPAFSSFSGFTQGTTYSIVFENKLKLNPFELKAKVEKIFADFNLSLSLYQDSSIVSKINRNEEAIPDSFFVEVFRKSQAISQLTGGAFDVTVGPLVKAWGFGPDAQKSFSEAKRDSLLSLVGMDKVQLKDGRIVKSDPGINLDFNAIAQGYSVDVISRYFDRLGLDNYLIEIGGEVRAKGDKDGTMWKIGIDKPIDDNMIPGNNLEAIIKLKDRSLATSGNYRKFYIENGIKYSHTIDPKTGYPARNQLLSATIVAIDCASADGVATACMVMGREKTIDFLAKHPEFEAYLIYSDNSGNFRTWASDALKGNISESESN